MEIRLCLVLITVSSFHNVVQNNENPTVLLQHHRCVVTMTA
jgi:hypothetical protein